MNTVTQRRLVTVAFVLLSMFALAAPVSANATARYKQQIEQFQAMLDEQAGADAKNLTEKDRALTQKWLQEAEVLLANGNHEAVAHRVRRVEYALDLIRAMVTAANIDATAERQEEYFYTSREQIKELDAEIEELQARKAQLTQELQRLRQ